MAEKRLTEIEVKLEGTELKLVEAESLNLAQVDEVTDLKATLDACEEKWYNEGFTDAENFVKPIVHQARHHGFGEGWLVALQVIGVAEDSPLRNPKQILYPAPPPLVQSQVSAIDEEDTPSMRELVQEIDSHVDFWPLIHIFMLNHQLTLQSWAIFDTMTHLSTLKTCPTFKIANTIMLFTTLQTILYYLLHHLRL